LDKAALLDERARWVLVRVALREACKVGEHRATSPQELEVLGVQVRDLLSAGAGDHAGALFNVRAISPAPRTSRASSSGSGSLADRPVPRPWFCCRAPRRLHA